MAIAALRRLLSQFVVVELINEGSLKGADVIDDVVDNFNFAHFAILGHVGNKSAQFAQVQLHLDVLGS